MKCLKVFKAVGFLGQRRTWLRGTLCCTVIHVAQASIETEYYVLPNCSSYIKRTNF